MPYFTSNFNMYICTQIICYNEVTLCIKTIDRLNNANTRDIQEYIRDSIASHIIFYVIFKLLGINLRDTQFKYTHQ